MSSTKKNVLYLSYDGMTDPLGQSQVLPYLIELSKHDYCIDLISFEKPDKFLKHRNTIEAICSNAGINWHPLKYTKKPPLLSTLYDIRKMRSLAKRIHTKKQLSIIHCRSYLSAIIGLEMKRKFGIKFLFDMRGFWADERIEGNIWNIKNPLFRSVYNYFKRKELDFLQHADHIISLTQAGKDELLSWKNIRGPHPKITVIPCCVDLQLFDPSKLSSEKISSLRSELEISESTFVLGYVGSIGTWYMLPEMLDFFKHLLSQKEDSLFLFVSGENPNSIYSCAEERGIDSAKLKIVSCLHQEVPIYISLFNASIFFIRPTFSKKASSPTKQGELMAMGIPIICNSGVGDTDRVIQTYNAGLVIETSKLENFKTDIEHLPFNIQTSKLGAREFYSLEVGAMRYLEVYENLVSSL